MERLVDDVQPGKDQASFYPLEIFILELAGNNAGFQAEIIHHLEIPVPDSGLEFAQLIRRRIKSAIHAVLHRFAYLVFVILRLQYRRPTIAVELEIGG